MVTLSKNSWHYKIQKLCFQDTPPESLCLYFWRTVASVILFPLAYPWKKINNIVYPQVQGFYSYRYDTWHMNIVVVVLALWFALVNICFIFVLFYYFTENIWHTVLATVTAVTIAETPSVLLLLHYILFVKNKVCQTIEGGGDEPD